MPKGTVEFVQLNMTCVSHAMSEGLHSLFACLCALYIAHLIGANLIMWY